MVEPEKLMILDASVMLKWFLEDEEDVEKAEEIFQEFKKRRVRIEIPSHAPFELMNILAIKAGLDSIESFSYFLNARIREHRLLLEVANIAVAIMQKCEKTSFYDAVYHATALYNKGVFVTADEDYYKKAKKLGGIKLLKDY